MNTRREITQVVIVKVADVGWDRKGDIWPGTVVEVTTSEHPMVGWRGVAQWQYRDYMGVYFPAPLMVRDTAPLQVRDTTREEA